MTCYMVRRSRFTKQCDNLKLVFSERRSEGRAEYEIYETR